MSEAQGSGKAAQPRTDNDDVLCHGV